MSNHGQRQKGTALVLVLWMSLFLSVVLAGTLALVRIETSITAAERLRFTQEQAARGALNEAAWALATASGQTAGRSPLPMESKIGDFIVTVDWSEIAGKADLNLAPENRLAALLTEAGLEPEDAARLAAQIADWRDHDNRARPNGAERRDYVNAPDGKEIGNRAFLTVEELDMVLDMPPALTDCLISHVTIHGMTSPPQDLEGVPRTGSRLALKATVSAGEPSGRSALHWEGLARITGQRTRPFEWIMMGWHPETEFPANQTMCE